jgi:hypothetical protein
MRRADTVVVAEGERTKRFTSREFGQILRASEFVAVVSFWREISRLAHPEWTTRMHAMGVLGELAERAFADCDGLAFSPQQVECFRHCGLTPLGVRGPGELGSDA